MKRYTLNEADLHRALRNSLIPPKLRDAATTELKWSVVGEVLTVSLFNLTPPGPKPEEEESP